jgi:hypothetical protein
MVKALGVRARLLAQSRSCTLEPPNPLMQRQMLSRDMLTRSHWLPTSRSIIERQDQVFCSCQTNTSLGAHVSQPKESP